MTTIERGIKEGLISFDDERKMITYLHQNKKRNYDNPEEKVQAETFLKLIFNYSYKPERIKQFEPVKMSVETKPLPTIRYLWLLPKILVMMPQENLRQSMSWI